MDDFHLNNDLRRRIVNGQRTRGMYRNSILKHRRLTHAMLLPVMKASLVYVYGQLTLAWR